MVDALRDATVVSRDGRDAVMAEKKDATNLAPMDL